MKLTNHKLIGTSQSVEGYSIREESARIPPRKQQTRLGPCSLEIVYIYIVL